MKRDWDHKKAHAKIRGSRSSRMVSHASRQKPLLGRAGTGRPSLRWTCLGLESKRQANGAMQLRATKTVKVLGRNPPRTLMSYA